VAILAGAIFVAAIAGVVTRPGRLDEAGAAVLGALAMLAFGVLPAGRALAALASQWNLFLFLLGLMLIAGLADAAGFFDAAGALAVRASRGSGRLLLVMVFAVGAIVTAFFSNDATALILTPVVYSVAIRLRLPPLPYLFATTFVADTASMTLPVSNPINVLVEDRLGLGLGGYTSHLLAASAVAVTINAALFLVLFRRETGRRFQAALTATEDEAAAGRLAFWLTCAGLVAIAAAYLAASSARLPVGPVAVGGAALLGTVALLARGPRLGAVRAHLSLRSLVYVAGLLVMVRGVEERGITTWLVGALAGFAGDPLSAAAAGLAGGAVGANLINNIPAVIVLISGSGDGHLAAGLRTPFLLGALAGADVGPNLTPVGSLSTMLWLLAVRRRGISVSALDYLRLGAVVTPALLLASGAAIAATFRL
jgi:arsenical pump membrane protein